MIERVAGFVLLSCFVACAAESAPGIVWTKEYAPTVLPDADGWGASKGANTSAELTDSGLRIVDAGTQQTQLHCYSYSWGARPNRGGAVSATVRVVSCTSRSGMCIHVSDGVHEDGLTLYPDRIVLAGAELEYAMDTTDDFHTYVIRIAGINIEVWVDGKLVIDGWQRFTKPAHNGRRLVMFGSISSPATGEAYWKSVKVAASTIPAEQVEGALNVIIYRKEGIYACFPSLIVLPDGRWVANFGTRVRRSHIDGTGGTARAVSNDEGQTWEITEEVFQDPRFVRDDGTRIVPHAQGWVYVNESELPTIEKRGRRWMHVREGTVAYLGDPRVRYTTPTGKTTVRDLPCPAAGGVMSFHHACSFLHHGNLWMTAVYGSTSQDGPSGVWGIRSDGNGKNWEIVTIADPHSIGRGFTETAICDNGRGEIIAMMRPKNESMNTFLAISSDGGKTWGPPRDTGLWGYPSHLLLLRDGRMLWTRGYRQDAMGIRAVLSEDGGHTWDVVNDIVVRADGSGNGSDNGYPISVQKSNGDIFTIYYLNDNENVTHIAGTHWRLPPLRK